MSAIVEKALWFIEHRYGHEVGLDDVAEHVGVSKFHLSRSFPAATGLSLSSYLRGRRLTEAAKALAAGAPDILAVALDAQYGSHEAFTRAFRDQFGLTPEDVRAKSSLDGLRLIEPIRMDESPYREDMAPPRFVDGPAMTIAGLSEAHDRMKPEGIPAQWQRFNHYLGHIPDSIPEAAYGVLTGVFEDTDAFRCLSGLEIQHTSRLQPELTAITLPAQRYAVFTHTGHVSKMRTTVNTIFNRWVPDLAIETGDFPSFIERYGLEFDPATGTGDVELWVPMRR
jgi:AraC family transcriptional regulator